MPDALMPIATLERRGPLDSVAPIPGVRVVGPLRRVSLQGDIERYAGIPLPRTPLRALVSGETTILWLGPEEWLVLAAEGTAMIYGNASTVDVSHRQTGLEITGPAASELINSACPLDLDIVTLPIGGCTRTVFGKAQISLWRQGEQQFHLEVARSFAAYVHELLRQASI